jgi:hypothetical protein
VRVVTFNVLWDSIFSRVNPARKGRKGKKEKGKKRKRTGIVLDVRVGCREEKSRKGQALTEKNTFGKRPRLMAAVHPG